MGTLSSDELILVITTEVNYESAKDLAKGLLHEKYAACVSFQEINSMYWWESILEENREVQLLIKSTKRNLGKLLTYINENHSYKVPEVIFWEVLSSQSYRGWIEESLGAN